MAASAAAVTFLLTEHQPWKLLRTKKCINPTTWRVKPQAETVLRVKVAARLKLAGLAAVSEMQVKVEKFLPSLRHKSYFKCFFKWVGGVLALATLSDRKTC